MANIEKFLEEVEKCSMLKQPCLADLQTALETMRSFVARVGALFTESILVFAMSALVKANPDQKSKKRNVGLVQPQVAQVKGNKFGITVDMIHAELWQKAEQLLDQQPDAKPAKVPKLQA